MLSISFILPAHRFYRFSFFSWYDRRSFFAVEKLMGVMHLLSGIFLLCAPGLAPHLLLYFKLHVPAYALLYATVGLASATAFHLVGDKEKEFPVIRVFGTFGWIGAGFIVSYLLQGDTTAVPMYVAGAGSLLMGIYSFTLPHIPPRGAGKKVAIPRCDRS
jgi:hypothetical protein